MYILVFNIIEYTKDNTMSYIEAKDVKSPRKQWSLIEVLVDQGESGWSLAVGEWDGERCLTARWNGGDGRPAGNPQSRGNPTWFVLPSEFVEPLMSIVPPNKLALAKALLNIAA